MTDLLTLTDFYSYLRAAVKEAGGQSAFASVKGLSPAYVCDVLNARRDPGPAILAALGMAKVLRYKIVQKDDGHV